MQPSELLSILANSPRVAIDTETNSDLKSGDGPSWVTDEVFMVSLAWDSPSIEHSVWYDARTPGLRELIRWLYEEYRGRLVMFNAKFDRHMIRKTFGLSTRRWVDDVYIMCPLVDETKPKGLKPRSVLEFNDPSLAENDAVLKAYIKKHKLRSYAEVPVEITGPYAQQDTVLTLKLDDVLYPQVVSRFWELYRTEVRLTSVLIDMERVGVKVDRELLGRLVGELDTRLTDIENQVYLEVGHELDLASPSQLAKLLFEELRFPVVGRRSRTGEPSTDEAAIQELIRRVGRHPVLNLILPHRGLSKLKTSYVDPYLRFSRVDHRLHADFNQCGARTGRFSCSKPNLQQVTRPDEDKEESSYARQFFICDDGICQDYWDLDQIEMRGYAHYTGEPRLIETFLNGEDPYAEIAAWCFGGTRADYPKTSEKRRTGKVVSLAMVYGASGRRIGAQIGGSEDDGRRIVRQFFAASEKSRRFMNGVKDRLEERGFIFNTFGRRFHLTPDEAYKGVNSIIQGWAADLIKTTMVRIGEAIPITEERGMRLTIHDELRLDGLRPEEHAEVEDLIQSWDFKVPVKATHKHSDTNWAEAA